jgi:putative methyltransferase (TIGR04325 family)
MRWFKSNPPQGYDDEAIADLVVAKTKSLDLIRIEDVIPGEALLPTLLAIACSGNRVLDFGGGAGFHYLVASRAFPQRKFRWAIVEHPLMISRTKKLEHENLRFFLSPEEAADCMGGVDLLHSNGVLQYLEDPETMVRRLITLNPSSISWSRLLLGPQRAVETQVAPLSAHGPGPCPVGNCRPGYLSQNHHNGRRRILGDAYWIQDRLALKRQHAVGGVRPVLKIKLGPCLIRSMPKFIAIAVDISGAALARYDLAAIEKESAEQEARQYLEQHTVIEVWSDDHRRVARIVRKQ